MIKELRILKNMKLLFLIKRFKDENELRRIKEKV